MNNSFLKLFRVKIYILLIFLSAQANACIVECSIAANDVIAGRAVNFEFLQSQCPVSGAAAMLTGQGSKNQMPLCMAAYYRAGVNPTGGGDPNALTNRKRWWRDFFDEQLKPNVGFMTDEILSPLYGSFHVGAVLSTYDHARRSGDNDIANKAAQWLQAFWATTALVAYPGNQSDLTTHLYKPARPVELTQSGNNNSLMRGLTSATAGARQRGWGSDVDRGPHIGHVSLIHPMLSAALAIPNRSFAGKIYPPQGANCWGENSACGIGFNGGFALMAQVIAQESNWSFDGTGAINNFASNFDPIVVGLTTQQRNDLSALVNNNTDQKLPAALNMLAGYELRCAMTFVRTSNMVGSWFGGVGAGQAQARCNGNKGPFFAYTYNRDNDDATVLAPDFNTNAQNWLSYKTANNEICAYHQGPNTSYPAANKVRCIPAPSGDVAYQLYWNSNGIVRVDDDSGGNGGDGDVDCSAASTPDYAYEIISSNIGHPDTAECGSDPVSISIQVKNTGKNTWLNTDDNQAGNFRFGIHGQANAFSAQPDIHPFSSLPRASNLPANTPITCNQTHTFSWQLNQFSNLQPGEYTLYMGMLQELTPLGWFRSDSPPSDWDTAIIDVPELEAAIDISGPSGALQCGQSPVQGSVTITNRGGSTWGAASEEIYLRIIDPPENLIAEPFGGMDGIPLNSLQCGQSQQFPVTFLAPQIDSTQQQFFTHWTVMTDQGIGPIDPDDPPNSNVILANLNYPVTINCPPPGQCSVNADCSNGQICINGSCETPAGQCPATPMPVLRDDVFQLPGSGNALVDVLANDDNPSGIPLVISNASGSCSSAVNVLPDGSMLSVAAGQISADCSLQYQVAYLGGGNAGSANLQLLAGSTTDAVNIIQQPVSVNALAGQAVYFDVIAENAATYQWSENGLPIAGADQSRYDIAQVTLAQDMHVFNVEVCGGTPSACITSEHATLRVDTTTLPDQEPFNGSALLVHPVIPTRLEAENFDLGGDGVAYLDTTPATPGINAYREPGGVELAVDASASNGWKIAKVLAGEWLEYAVSIPASNYGQSTQEYYLAARWRNGGGTMRISAFDGDDLNAATAVSSMDVPVAPPTFDSAFYTQQTLTIPDTGSNKTTLRFEHLQNSSGFAPFELDYLVLRAKCRVARQVYAQRSTTIVPSAGVLPVEAEHFDDGCNAYWDSSINHNTQFPPGHPDDRRNQDVDLLYVDWAGSAVITDAAPGEHVSYSFDLEQSGQIEFTLQLLGNEIWVSQPDAPNPQIRLEVLDAAGQLHTTPISITVPKDVNGPITAPAVALGSGSYVLRLATEQGGYNLNRINLRHIPPAPTGSADDDLVQFPWDSLNQYQISGCALRTGDNAIHDWDGLSITAVNGIPAAAITMVDLSPSTSLCGWRVDFSLPDNSGSSAVTFDFDYTFRDGDVGDPQAPVVGPAKVTVNVDQALSGPVIALPDTLLFELAADDYVIVASDGPQGVLGNDTPDVDLDTSYYIDPDNIPVYDLNDALVTDAHLQVVTGGLHLFWRLTPPEFHDGSPLKFKYRVINANNVVSEPAVVTVNLPRHPLWANHDQVSIVWGTSTLIEKAQLLENDDWDAPIMDDQIRLVIDSANVVYEDIGDALLVTPAAQTGQQLIYHLTDDPHEVFVSPPATVSFNVLSAGFAPVASNDVFNYPRGATQMVIPLADLLVNDAGLGPALYAITSPPELADGSIEVTGEAIIFTASSGFSGVTEFEYRLIDINNVLSADTARVSIRSWPLQEQELKEFFLLNILSND